MNHDVTFDTITDIGKRAAAKGRRNGHRTQAKRGAFIGATEAVRTHLSRTEGWNKGLTKAELAERTGYPYRTVSSVVSSLAGHMGGLVSFGKKGSRRYALNDSPAAHAAAAAKKGKTRATGEFAIAAEITIGRGWRWGAGY